MTSAALISLRETLETSLIVGIMLTLLSRLDRTREQRTVWLGVGCGIAVSIVVAFAFRMFAAHLMHEAKELYEGMMMLTAAALLTWMILWMMRAGSGFRTDIEQNVRLYALSGQSFAIFLLSFTTTAREGTEMVVFLNAALINAKSDLHSLLGTITGMIGAILLTCMVFRGSKRFSLRTFFLSTGILLLLFAAGLVSHGIGALQEAGIATVLQTHIWDLTAILPEESLIGGILESMIGYSDQPTLLQLLTYSLYLIGAGYAWKRTQRFSATT